MKTLKLAAALSLAAALLIFSSTATAASAARRTLPFEYSVDPATFQLTVESGGIARTASGPSKKRPVADYLKTSDGCRWRYPDESVSVELKKEADHLRVTIGSERTGSFTWPLAAAESYTLPLWEGKYVPAEDPNWKAFLKKRKFCFAENFSMRFFALNDDKFAIVYIVENMFNDEVAFDSTASIKFSFTHEFPATNKEKRYGFRIYVTSTDPVDIAKVYKSYVKETCGFATLEEKAASNPNIRKLYGAPHFYLWEREFIVAENVDWNKFKKDLKQPQINRIVEFIEARVEDGAEVAGIFRALEKQDYVAEYQKKAIVNAINHAMLETDFAAYIGGRRAEKPYTAPNTATAGARFPAAGYAGLARAFAENKKALKDTLGDAIAPDAKWGNGNSLELLDEIEAAGIKRAWLGFGMDWVPGLINPEFVLQANRKGYLIGAYDSYHSIHDKCDPEWITAYFDDKDLYENATVANKDGKKIGGFLGRGRQLNPTLSMPAVKARMDAIFTNEVAFNSWFVDCDGYGEFFDDHTPGRMTTQADDMNARLARMKWMRDEKKLVLGTELGNDYTANTVAFAHGMETPVFGYGDPDMKKNEKSPYFLGKYWSPEGGISPIYVKPVPLKTVYRHAYLDPVYSLPLFRLVYGDSVVTTHHWEFSSLKFTGEIENRMIFETLYAFPPLYHVDRREWKKNREIIVAHCRVWTPFHEKAAAREMTGFRVLSKDRLVQMTAFGADLRVVANFSGEAFKFGEDTIAPRSLVIYDGGVKREYTPKSNFCLTKRKD